MTEHEEKELNRALDAGEISEEEAATIEREDRRRNGGSAALLVFSS
jgi:hypothetical protein